MEEINAPDRAPPRPPLTVRELVARLAADGHARLSVDDGPSSSADFAGADHAGLRFAVDDSGDLVSIPTENDTVAAEWGDDGVTLRPADGRTYRIEYRPAKPRSNP